MSHEEWLLHQNAERTLDLIDYISRQLYTQDKDTFDPILNSLIDLSKYLGKNWQNLNTNNQREELRLFSFLFTGL